MSFLSKLNQATPEDWDKANKVTGSIRDVEYPKEFVPLCPPTETQVGGSHYMNYKIQPIEYTLANNLSFCQGNVIKYITRYKDKNGVEDLKKAKHYIDLIIEEYDGIERAERKYEEDNGFY